MKHITPSPVTIEDDEYPLVGYGDTTEEAKEQIAEKKEEIKAHEELGERIDQDYFCYVKKVAYGDYIKVKVGVNASHPHIFNFLGRGQFHQFRMSEGFVVWEDIMKDNYFARSIVCAFADDELDTGNTAFGWYKLQLFQTISHFWD